MIPMPWLKIAHDCLRFSGLIALIAVLVQEIG